MGRRAGKGYARVHAHGGQGRAENDFLNIDLVSDYKDREETVTSSYCINWLVRRRVLLALN